MFTRRAGLVVAVVVAWSAVLGCTVLVPVREVTDPPPAVTGASAGCGTTAQEPITDEPRTILVDGEPRRYTITVPPNHVAGTSTPIPLVLDFHGLLEGLVGTHPFATQFSATARDEGFAVAFPVGSNNGINWDVSARETNPDLRFIDALLAELGDGLCLDRSRMYVTGLSYGAFMTSMLMCMRPNTFAAAAPVAGVQDRCAATERKIPFLAFHGTADQILPFDLFAATPQAIAAKYGCDPAPSVANLSPQPDPATRGLIVRTTWDCTAVGSAAESITVAGGGHSWPGSAFFTLVEPIVGPTATTISATELIWEFFERHRL